MTLRFLLTGLFLVFFQAAMAQSPWNYDFVPNMNEGNWKATYLNARVMEGVPGDVLMAGEKVGSDARYELSLGTSIRRQDDGTYLVTSAYCMWSRCRDAIAHLDGNTLSWKVQNVEGKTLQRSVSVISPTLFTYTSKIIKPDDTISAVDHVAVSKSE
jgi:hypothetical protein